MKSDESFHWGWVAWSAGAGAGLIALAHLGDLVWGWPTITTGTLTNIGAAVVIAFVLFVIERRFTRSIQRTVTTATRAAVEHETRAFNDRLDSLEDQIAARRDETESVQNALVSALGDDLTYETVHDALEEASRVGGIKTRVTVRGSQTFQYPLVTFAYEARSTMPTHWATAELGPKMVYVSVVVEPRESDYGTPVIEATWVEGMTAADLVSALDERLRSREYRAEAKALDIVFAAAELARGISITIADQQAPIGTEQLSGALIELIDDSWAITTDGVQSLTTGYRGSWKDLGLAFAGRAEAEEIPPAPDGVDDDTWDFVYDRILAHAPTSWW